MTVKARRLSVGAPENWLEHARSDLRLARLGVGQGVLAEQICFHAQQAVEKALKAVLLARKVEFPRTHDLEELLSILAGAGLVVPAELEEAGALTPYAVETRYPGYWGEISVEDTSSPRLGANGTSLGRRIDQSRPLDAPLHFPRTLTLSSLGLRRRHHPLRRRH